MVMKSHDIAAISHVLLAIIIYNMNSLDQHQNIAIKHLQLKYPQKLAVNLLLVMMFRTKFQ